MKSTNVLVTGAGSLVGQGILRLLNEIDRPLRIITADPDSRGAGHWLGNKCYLVPMAKDPNYGKSIEDLIIKENIDIIFVGTDTELTYFSNNKSHLESLGAIVIVCSPEVVEIADDKFLTTIFLKDNGFAYPCSALASDKEECLKLIELCGLPLFGKPRRGARSVGARVIKTNQEYLEAQANEPDLIFQEFLPGDEYTAGCIGIGDDVGGVVVLKRDLKDGNTFRAYHDGTNKFEKEIKEVASKLKINGSCNFQFRVKDNIPVIFEINARCSGTTPLRSIFGFNEIEAILNKILDGTPIPQPTLRAGTVLRTWSDLFIEDKELFSFNETGELDNPKAEPINFIK